MNDRQNENASRIAAYLGNRLSPEEREAFKRLLSEDDELRVQYVDALMNRAGKESGAAEAVPEPEVREPVSDPEVRETMPEPEVRETVSEGEVAPEPAVSEVVPEQVVREAVPELEVREVVPEPEVAPEPEVSEAWEAGWQGEKKRAKPGFLGSGWIVGVTVLLLIIAGVVIYIMTSRQQYWDKAVTAMTSNGGDADKVVPIDSAAAARSKAAMPVSKVDSAATTKGSSLRGGMMDSLYAELYKPYMRGDDPMEVRQYYHDYKAGNYAAVLAASDSVATAVGAHKLQLKNYIRLYKGLAYLATGNATEAVERLDAVVLRTNPGDGLYETARWYLALAWLKRNDVDPAEAQGKALGLARDISRGYSRYREPARELVRSLGS